MINIIKIISSSSLLSLHVVYHPSTCFSSKDKPHRVAEITDMTVMICGRLWKQTWIPSHQKLTPAYHDMYRTVE